ncbi:MAG: UvrB/UvrC motif-containing protein, partial [Bacteroidota bacterium]
IAETKKAMQEASKELDFIQAAQYRDEMYRLEKVLAEKKE